MGTPTVVCVLRSGGDFGPEHVARLREQAAYYAQNATFTCFTDMDGVTGGSPLHHDWPGWWSKIEAFRTPGPALYLDLDVTIMGNLTPLLELAAERPFVVCGSFKNAENNDMGALNTSVMGWGQDMSAAVRMFAIDADRIMARYNTRERWGDQAWIADILPEWATWQDELPGAVRSFKRDMIKVRRPFDQTALSVLVSHGKPRPWENNGADRYLKRARAA